MCIEQIHQTRIPRGLETHTYNVNRDEGKRPPSCLGLRAFGLHTKGGRMLFAITPLAKRCLVYVDTKQQRGPQALAVAGVYMTKCAFIAWQIAAIIYDDDA